jgi:SP family sugar:H+ symporter-like MFS transporter
MADVDISVTPLPSDEYLPDDGGAMPQSRDDHREALPLLLSSGKPQPPPPLADGASSPLSPSTPPPPTSRYAYLVSFLGAISGLLFGFEIGLADTVLKMPSFVTYFGTGEVDPLSGEVRATSVQADIDGNIVASFLVGCVFGAVLSSLLTDRIGRKRTIVVGALVFTLGGIAQALAVGTTTLYLARALSGISIGLLSSATPLYLSEIAPTAERGRIISIQQLMITIGILLASIMNSLLFLLVDAGSDAQWRGALGAQAVPGTILLALVGYLPFSPRWLMSRGRTEEAIVVISRLRGAPRPGLPGGGLENAHVKAEVEEIAANVEEERAAGSATWRDVVGLRQTWVAIGLQTGQQWSGINFLLYFAADLFGRIGLDKGDSATTLVIVNAVILIVGTLPGMWGVEVLGRRKLLLWGGLGMAAAHGAICVCITVSSSTSGDAAVAWAWAAVGCMFSFTFIFSATWGPVVWVVQNEILPLRARSKGVALATLANWAHNAVIGKATPLIVSEIEGFTYAMFAALCLVATAYTYVRVPETKGVPLERMEEVFRRHTRATQTGQRAERVKLTSADEDEG